MRRPVVFWSVVWLAAIAAFAHAWALRWSCDDAYISFRYAQHFVEGHGLVFNLDSAERPVEGYSNFAWTMWLAVGMELGFTGDAVETWGHFWGALMHAGVVLLLGRAAWRSSRGRAWVPIAAPAWAAHHHAASLAPAGLETAMFVLLGTAMALLAIERRCRRHVWMLGFLGVLAAMTRPDGALFVVAAGAVVAWDAWRARSPADVVAYAVPLVLCMVPYLLWRHSFYGYWVPNTSYAKSASDPYLSQGLFYVWEYCKCYGLALLPAVLATLALPLRRGTLFDAVDPWSGRRAGVVLLLFALPYLLFVLWVGGDFMFARFLLPITPLLLLGIDVVLQGRPRLGVGAAAIVTGCMLWRHEPEWLGDYKNPNGLSDNRTISLPLLDYARSFGGAFQQLANGLDLRIGIAGGHANIAYRGRVPVAVECAAGHTDEYIAHLPIRWRGMTGHERPYTLYPGYLEKRGVQIMFEQSFHTDDSLVDLLRDISFPVPGYADAEKMPARIVIWDRALMAELKRREPRIVCVDMDAVLDRYLRDIMPTTGRDKVRSDYEQLRRFYFDHNDDPAHKAAFEDFLK